MGGAEHPYYFEGIIFFFSQSLKLLGSLWKGLKREGGKCQKCECHVMGSRRVVSGVAMFKVGVVVGLVQTTTESRHFVSLPPLDEILHTLTKNHQKRKR